MIGVYWVFFVVLLTAQGWTVEPHEFHGPGSEGACQAVRAATDQLYSTPDGPGAGVMFLSPCLRFEVPP